jgi:ATP-dependent DNA helicase RecQ
MMRREPERAAKVSRSSSRKASPAADLSPEAAPVFERLRTWRAATAKEQGVPAYVIFHDATLRQIATELPSTLAELGTISGVGENKLAKYGDGVLETLGSD